MAWRKPPKIAVRGMKKKGGECAPNAADAAAAAGEAAVAAGQAAAAAGEAASAVAAAGGASRLSRLSAPKGGVTVKARRNPKEVREAAMAKKLAALKGKSEPAASPGGTPRVRTTVTKTKSTPAGQEETTIVEKVTSGPAIYKPRYNRKKVLHPADVYREKKLKPPSKPDKPPFKVERGKYYSKEEVRLWESWQKWNEYVEEVKCWKKNIPYETAQEKYDKAFARQFKKDEEMQERMYKSGKLKIKPFHMRHGPEDAPAKEKKKKPAHSALSPPIRKLPKSPGGKKRFEKKNPCGYYIRYNCVGDRHPQDIYESEGMEPPAYVQPPLKEDGTFKLAHERTKEESDAYTAYKKWEQFYFQLQAWEGDKKWEGAEPGIMELVRAFDKLPKKGAGGAQGRAQDRANVRANRKEMAEQARREKMSRTQKNTEANQKKMGFGKLTGAARVALESAAKKEAKARAAEQAKKDAISQRQRSFLKRGERCAAVTPARKLDLSKVQSRIGGLIRAQRAAAAQPEEPPPPCEPPPEPYDIPSPPRTPYAEYQGDLQARVRQRRSEALCNRMTGQIARHLKLTGQMGHLPTNVGFYSKGERPPPRGAVDVTILNYDQMRQPVASLFGGPCGDVDEEEGEMQGCDPASPGWYEPDEPIERGRFKWGRLNLQHPSPPKSQNLRCTDDNPMHPFWRMKMQYDMAEIMDDNFYFAEQELEDEDESAYLNRCMNYQMNKPLRDRAAAMQAQTDPNLLHPGVYRSELQRRAEDIDVRGQMLAELGRECDMMNMDLPDVERRPVQRAWNIPSPDVTPEPPCDDLLELDSPGPCDSVCPPRRMATPPPAYTPPRAPSPPSPFVMPERFAGGPNPLLEQARACIAEPMPRVPYRGEEIAAQAARTARAAEPRVRPDLYEGFEGDEFEDRMREQQCLDAELEGMDLTPPPCQPGVPVFPPAFPEYRQLEGPQYGALYHQQIRQPQLGPWHTPRPGC